MTSRLHRVKGRICLAGTAIPTADVYYAIRAGAEPFDLLKQFPGLDLDMIEYAGSYERRKAERKSPEGREKRRHGAIQKRRGYQCEKQLEARLSSFGFRRVPLSGALGGKLSGDLRRDVDDGKAVRIIEAKRRVGANRSWRTWLKQGGAHLLVVVPGNGEEPLAVLELQTIEHLLREGGYTA